MIIDNMEYKITDKYKNENYNNNKLYIKLKGVDNVTDMRYICFMEVNHYHQYLIFQNGILAMLLI